MSKIIANDSKGVPGLNATATDPATVGRNITITAGDGGNGSVDLPNGAKGGNLILRGGLGGAAESGGYAASGGDVFITGGLPNGQNAGAVHIGDDSAETVGVVIGNNSASTKISGFTIDIGGQEAAAVQIQLLRPDPSLGGRSDLSIKSAPSPEVADAAGVTGGILFLGGGDGTAGDGSHVSQSGGEVNIAGGVAGPDGGSSQGSGGTVRVAGGQGGQGGYLYLDAGEGSEPGNDGDIHIGNTHARGIYLGNQFSDVNISAKVVTAQPSQATTNLTGVISLRAQMGRNAVVSTNIAGLGGEARIYGGDGGHGSSDYAGGSGGGVVFQAGMGGADYGGGWGQGGSVSIQAGASGDPASRGVISIGTVGGTKSVELGGPTTPTNTGGTFSPDSLAGSVASVGATIPILGLSNSIVTVQLQRPSGDLTGRSDLIIRGAIGPTVDDYYMRYGGYVSIIGGEGGAGNNTHAGQLGGQVSIIGGAGGADGGAGVGAGGSVYLAGGVGGAAGGGSVIINGGDGGVDGSVNISNTRGGTIIGNSGSTVDMWGTVVFHGAISRPGISSWSNVGILTTPTGVAQDSGFDLPEGSILLAMIFRIDIPEVVGTTKTMNVGSLATPALWASAVDVTRAFGNYLLTAGGDMGSGLVPFGLINAANKRVYFTAGSGDWTAFRGRLYFLTVTGP